MILKFFLSFAMSLLSFMFAPLNVVLPYEVVSILLSWLNYIADGLRLVIFFCFDAWVVRAVFGFVLSLNGILLAWDLIWRVISYIKFSRDG